MKSVLTLLALVFCLSAFSQTTPLSFTPLGSNPQFGPGRGSEQWQHAPWDNSAGVNSPAGNSTPGPDYYTRFVWKDVESDVTAGSYNFTEFDRRFKQAMDAHQRFSFGIMPMCSGCGSTNFIPTYLHNLMQTEATKDWFYSTDGCWVPNWNSNYYITRYTALLQAIANHIAVTSYQPGWAAAPIPFSKVLWIVDIRGYGNYGEWHVYPWSTAGFPSSLYPTSSTLKALINANLAIFPNYQNNILIGAFTTMSASFVPVDVSYYALTASNTFGKIGWRRDNWGDPQYSVFLENNTETYNPGSGTVNIKDLIMNQWKYAPITGEPNHWTTDPGCGSPYCDLLNQVNRYHADGIGNGNYGIINSATQTNYQNAMAAAGYRLQFTGGTMTTTLTPSSAFNITLNWKNLGLAPVYNNWTVTYRLKSGSTVVWSGNSYFNPRLQILATDLPVSDNFTLPAIAPGTYDLDVIITDPDNYMLPLPINITGRQTDGSYPIRSGITVASGGGNIPPVANAGADQTITSPAASVSISGSGSDADGTVTSHTWSYLSGPGGSSIASPSSYATTINGLVPGTYFFRLTVVDNLGASATDDIMIQVNGVPAACSKCLPDRNYIKVNNLP